MKRIFSLLLVVMLLVSAVPTAYATNDYTAGTAVTYTADDEANESWTVTVPAKLAPGGSGTVTLQGTWPSNKTITVTAQESVDLVNSISGADAKNLAVSFVGISEAGNNIESQKFTESVSVEPIANAIFGVWSGHFYYNVDTADYKPVPGLYTRGTNFTELIAPWDELVESGAIFVEDYEGMKVAMDGFYYALQAGATMPDDKYRYGDLWVPEDENYVMILKIHYDYCMSWFAQNGESVEDAINNAINNPETIRIPNSVQMLNVILTNIEYEGTTEQWINLNWDNSRVDGIPNLYINGDLIGQLVIPDGTIEIPDQSFSTCYSITSVRIPKSVTKIGWGAFNESWNIEEIIYEGTSAEWKNINIVDSTDYDWWDDLKTTQVYCEGDDTYVPIL